MKKYKKLIYGILSFLIPFVILVIIFGVNNLFTRDIYIKGDVSAQYYPFFNYLKGVFSGTNSIFYSFYKNLGGTMFGTFFYYLSSPFNVFVNFVSSDSIMLFFLWLIIIKISLCSLSMYLYMTYKNNTTNILILMFSVCYALMGYNINYFVNFMWLDVVIMTPIVLIGLDKLINKESPKLYIISLFISIFCNYYMSYMLCIFCVLYFIYNVLLKYSDKSEIIKLVKRFIIVSALTGLMCSFFLLPCIVESRNYLRSLGISSIFTFDYNLFDIFSKSFIGSIAFKDLLNNGSMNIYCGIIVLPLVYLFLVNKNISKKKRRLTLFLILFMILPCFVFPLNYFWHLFSKPSYYTYRYSFLLCFFLINIAYESYHNLNINKLHVMFYLAVYCVLSFYFILIVCFGNYYDFLNYKHIWITLIFLFSYLLLLKLKNRDICKIIICCLILFENIINLCIIFKNPVIFTKKNTVNDYYFNIVSKYNTDRLEFTDYINGNDSLWMRYYGINHFISTNNNRVMKFFLQMSSKQEFTVQNIYKYKKDQYILDTIVGLRYVASTYKIDNYNLLEEIKADDDKSIYIYENPNFVGLGYIINDKCNNISFDFKFDENVFNCITGRNDSFYKEYSIKKNDDGYSSIIKNPSNFYLYYPSIIQHKMKFDNNILSFASDSLLIENNIKNYNFKFSFYDEIDIENFKIYYFDFEKYKSSVKQFNTNKLDYKIIDNKIVGSINSDGGLLMVTIPYEKGFDIKVDGKKVNYEEVLDTFIGFNLDKGYHDIVIEYHQPYLKSGICLSFLSFTLLIIFLKKLY